MKSAYVSVAPVKQKWHTRRTIKRETSFRPIEAEDVKYAWAAYRSNGLSGFEEDLPAKAFKARFVEMILSKYDAAWTLFAGTKRGFIPVGLALGFYPHPDVDHVLIFNQFVWFPWASPRNKLESAVSFFNAVRHKHPMIGFAREKDRKFMQVVSAHGIVKRRGTSKNIFPDDTASIWETRT